MKNFPLNSIAQRLEEASQIDEAKELYETTLKSPISSEDDKVTAGESLRRLNQTEKEIEIVTIFTKNLKSLPAIKELSDLIPLSPNEYDAMKEDIQKRGIQVPLAISPQYGVICGSTRWKIAEELGLETVPCIIISLKDNDLIKYAANDNLMRRQLSSDQRRKLVQKLLSMAGKRQTGRPRGTKDKTTPVTKMEIAKAVGVSTSTVSREARKKFNIPKSKGVEIERIEEKFNFKVGKDFTALAPVEVGRKISNVIENSNLNHGDSIKIKLIIDIKRKEERKWNQ